MLNKNRGSLQTLAVALAALAAGCATMQPSVAVKEMLAITPDTVEVRALQPGAMVYTDRIYTVERHPEEMRGLALVATPCSMKQNTRDGVRITLAKSATVYVGYRDDAAKRLPFWLSERFEKTPLTIRVHQPADQWAKRPEARWEFTLHKAALPAGVVQFGANAGPGLEGNPLHYIVLVDPADALASAGFVGRINRPTGSIVRPGVRAYPDRNYTLKNVPGEMRGAIALALGQAEALDQANQREVVFDRDAIAYLAYDASSESVPDWVAAEGFTKTELRISIGNVVFCDDKPMAVYRRDVKAGDVLRLGANRAAGWSGWPMQYLLVVK